MKNYLFPAFLTLVLFSIACHKDTVAPATKSSIIDDLPAFYACSNANNWTNTSLQNAVVGNWKWVRIKKSWGGGTNDNTHIGRKIEFLTNSIVLVKKNGILIETGTWKIENLKLSTTFKNVSDMNGPLYMCDNFYATIESPYDGNDNFWEKE
jgi:hypothetical protein